jgi:PAS domain S-box-containing protein
MVAQTKNNAPANYLAELTEKYSLLKKENSDLVQRESLLRATLENISDTVVITDDNGRFTFVCPNTNLIFGLSTEQVFLLGSVDKLVHGPICNIDRLRAEKEINNIERSFVDSSGTRRFLLINAKIVKISGGTVLYVMREITDIKLAEEEKQSAESKFQNFIANFPGVAYQFRLSRQGDYSYDYISDACGLIFGVPAAEIVKDASLIISLIPETDLEEVKRAIMDSADTMTPYQIEHRVVRPNGKMCWIKASSTPRKVANGDIVWDGICLDITVLKMVQQELEATETKYRTVVEDQTELISRFTADGKFLFVNQAYCRYFDKKPDDLLKNRWQPAAFEEDRGRIEQQLMQLSPANPVVVIENRVYKGDGGIRWVQFINRGIFDSADTLIEIQSVGRDISDLKEIQMSLQQKEDELSKKNSRLERLNIALEVVIEQKSGQLENLRADIIRQYNSLVKPHIDGLKSISQNRQDVQYLTLIEHGIQQILSPFAQQISSLSNHLSPMETKVASLITSGITIKGMALELKISPHTVKYHRKNIRSKLGIRNQRINLRSYLLGDLIQEKE